MDASGVSIWVLTVQDRATVTLTRRSDADAIWARGGALAIATRTQAPNHRSGPSGNRPANEICFNAGIAKALPNREAGAHE